jgi:hypothetical protein
LSSLCFLGVASPAFPVMKCTPPAMIPSRSGFTFGHMGGIISVSPLAAALMPAMDLYLRKVVHLGPATTTARSSRTMVSRSRSARSGFSTVRQLAPGMRGASPSVSRLAAGSTFAESGEPAGAGLVGGLRGVRPAPENESGRSRRRQELSLLPALESSFC